MFFGHLPEILLLLVLALLVFGPKRMIEMGSSFGKMFREFREATRDMSWSNLLGTSDVSESRLSRPSQSAPPFTPARSQTTVATSSTPGPSVVDGSIEHPREP
jgi:sec-independent protein translocase protein TatA